MILPGFYTGEQIRERLGLAPRELRRLISAGVLISDRLTKNGWALYAEHRLKYLQARKEDGTLFHFDDTTSQPTAPVGNGHLEAYNAEDGIRVFELIEKGVPMHLIAIQLKTIHPRVIDQIRQDYDRLSGSMTIPKTILDRINGLKRLSGRFPLRSPADLQEVLVLADSTRLCTSCKLTPATSECGGCVYARAEQDMKDAARARDASKVDAIKVEAKRETAA